MDRTTCHEGQSVRKLLDRALPVCFFMGLFVYVWMAIEPRLLYYGFGVFAEFPRFSWEGMFLKVSLSTPGGPLSLLVGFLAQWYYLSWLARSSSLPASGSCSLVRGACFRRWMLTQARIWPLFPPFLGC